MAGVSRELQIAFHEAGHAVVASRLDFDYEGLVWEDAHRAALVPSEEQSRLFKDAKFGRLGPELTEEQRSGLQKHIRVFLAGHLAEHYALLQFGMAIPDGGDGGAMDRVQALAVIRALHGRSFWAIGSDGEEMWPGDEDLDEQERSFYSREAEAVLQMLLDDIEIVLTVGREFERLRGLPRQMVEEIIRKVEEAGL